MMDITPVLAWCQAPEDGDKKREDQQLADKMRQIFTDNNKFRDLLRLKRPR